MNHVFQSIFILNLTNENNRRYVMLASGDTRWIWRIELEIYVWSHAASGYAQSVSTGAIKRRTIIVKAKRSPVAASFPQAKEKKKGRTFILSVWFHSSFWVL